ncbi:phosphate acyltransferase PlsX [Pseudemcibacter aquimaris]|uniref:phosphate acyltransferase PlsX n=1 Tax=Pseudemcibacter aquimaris TaxID=2857064 RepID=UPI002011FBC4|nr:phosphate acyltransferase PlsX [Pseudemcibacter aquimaris]MCC3860613.1 phosphate acyltransferase PlsX [Pseudemcibacter aquimaris]WDU59433.1 phosphate acyltransferase PlsX [Pseudemcibacter aquimaris]
MTRELVISLDAMGGDDAPDIVIEGAAIARERVPNLKFIIYGDETKVVPLITKFPILKDCCEVSHTDKVISADEKPSQALRRGRDSSMGQSIQAVKDGKACAAVLAGNTGAQMALAKFILRTMDGIDRPALASLIPTTRGESVMLDLGANVECDENNLTQFAIMGAAFARTVLGVQLPSVAILNVGVEELKGSDVIQNADKLLRNANLPMDYKGFTEGHGLGGGEVDVVVTDGFTGNIALKTAEGTAKMIANLLKRSLNESVMSKIGAAFASSSLMSLKNHLDPNNHNGAVFMGLNGLVIKSHGGASAKGFAAAIGVAVDMAENDLAGKITRDLKNFNSTIENTEDVDTNETVIEMNIKEQK